MTFEIAERKDLLERVEREVALAGAPVRFKGGLSVMQIFATAVKLAFRSITERDAAPSNSARPNP
jgi:hypothetical protein